MEFFHHNDSNVDVKDDQFNIPTFQRLFPQQIASRPSDAILRISKYSKRAITYESDTLNGMLGIFNALGEMDTPLHYLSVPIFTLFCYEQY